MHVCNDLWDTRSRIGGGSVVFPYWHTCLYQIAIPSSQNGGGLVVSRYYIHACMWWIFRHSLQNRRWFGGFSISTCMYESDFNTFDLKRRWFGGFLIFTCMQVSNFNIVNYKTLAPKSEVVWWFFHIDMHVCMKFQYLRPKTEVVWWFLDIYIHACIKFQYSEL